MTAFTYNGEPDLLKCPFRKDKKGICKTCFGGCALYTGNFPFGDCAIRVVAEGVLVDMKERMDKADKEKQQ